MPLELSELQSYSSVKGHRTRVEKDIGNLVRLLTATYSVTSEDRLNDRLEKLQTYTHRLSDIAEYLVALKYAKARNHRDEVADFKEVLEKCSEDVFRTLHERHAAAPRDVAPALAAPAAAARTPSKPLSSKLKPEKLTHDASTSTFRTWKAISSLLRLRTIGYSTMLPATGIPMQLFGQRSQRSYRSRSYRHYSGLHTYCRTLYVHCDFEPHLS